MTDILLQTSPLCEAVNGLATHGVTDIDLTPTEEAAPSPGPPRSFPNEASVRTTSACENPVRAISQGLTGTPSGRSWPETP